MIDTDEEIQ